MTNFVTLLVVLAVAAVVISIVLLIQRRQHRLQLVKQERGRELERLIREDAGTSSMDTSVEPRNTHQYGGVSSAFMSEFKPSPPDIDTRTQIEQLQKTSSSAEVKADANVKREENKMLRRAELQYLQLMAEVNRANRGPISRQPGPCSLQIEYVDADGVWTTRRIAPYKSGNTNEKFDAWCELRQERRTFFFGRIQCAVHLTTGKVITRAGVFQLIHPKRRVPSDIR